MKIFYLLIFTSLAMPQLLWATNGMNMIGYGAVSNGMGGADLALVDNTTAMNINPAGLAGCCNGQFSFGDSLMQPRSHHQDKHGNDTEANYENFHLPLLAWAQPLKKYPFIVGFGFFAQGGMGVRYNDLQIPFLTDSSAPNSKDELSSEFSYAKITPTVAWYSADRRLRLGASLNIGYIEANMSLFPHTSLFIDNNDDHDAVDPGETAFFGMKMEDSRALATAVRLGFQYQIGNLSFGGAYLSGTNVHLDGGTTQINYSAIGQGLVDYNTELSGFNWPQQAGIGISYQVNSKLKVAMDIDWIDWSSAMKSIKFRINRPNNADSVSAIAISYPMNWRDQWVYALGAEYSINQSWLIRFGYNHGNNPVPSGNLLPFFPAIVEDHITAGTGISMGKWKIDIAFEWALKNAVSSTNSLFCEHGFSEENSQFTSHLMISYLL